MEKYNYSSIGFKYLQKHVQTSHFGGTPDSMFVSNFLTHDIYTTGLTLQDGPRHKALAEG